MTTQLKVAKNIKEARLAMGLTQKEFGQLVGLAESSVSLYEILDNCLSTDYYQDVPGTRAE